MRLPSSNRGQAITAAGTRWILKQFVTRVGAFRLSPESSPCLIGTACAALACETLGTLSSWSEEERAAAAAFICGHQEEDGWFRDPLLVAPPRSQLDSAYLKGHATFLAVMGLDALGRKPPQPFRFLHGWRNDERLYTWIDGLDWTNPWRESNWVEWIGYWLLAEAGITAADVPVARDKWPAGFAGLVTWLKDHQDPKTGMWGSPPFDEPMRTLHLMAGAYHHYVFYYATGEPLPYLDAIVDHTLALQQPDGLFVPGRPGGGPCEDLDAIDILANMHRLTDYRKADIEAALLRAIQGLLENQRPSGAFVYAFDPGVEPTVGRLLRTVLSPRYPPGPRTRMRVLARLAGCDGNRPDQHYAGSPGLPFISGGGDMFSMWFRPLAIAIAASALGRDRSPIWWDFGFRRQITQGWFPLSPSDSRSEGASEEVENRVG